MSGQLNPGGIWVFCEPAPTGVHPVAFELLGQASRLAADMRCSVTALLPGGSTDAAPKLAAGGADFVLLAGNADSVNPDELQYTEMILLSCCWGPPPSAGPWRRGWPPGWAPASQRTVQPWL